MSRIRARHDVDRALPEFLQELRVAQTGGQIFFAFLFTVAFTPAFSTLSDGQRDLYLWTLFVVATSGTALIAPVAVHQWNFGRRMRSQWLIVTHLLASAGLALLAIGMVLGLALVSSVVVPDGPLWVPLGSAAMLLALWVVLPLALRLRRIRSLADARADADPSDAAAGVR